ncbi:hypothetical protein E1200_20725 [Actinomadura sp. GC306]|nr:hypothetical protein E1200_20725 [Actinomadura sp. GC306]
MRIASAGTPSTGGAVPGPNRTATIDSPGRMAAGIGPVSGPATRIPDSDHITSTQPSGRTRCVNGSASRGSAAVHEHASPRSWYSR